MRCDICGAPLAGDDRDNRKLCDRCLKKTSARERVSAVPIISASRAASQPATIERRPLSSGTIATGFTRTDPPGSSRAPRVTPGVPNPDYRRSDPAAATLSVSQIPPRHTPRHTQPTAASASAS
ncbi:MAG: hypothetical protein JXX14_20650, partial [Deltaproteobacteria bacterium]|nr:hypothetical protein [Deltaproteobacteria bacterium]